VICRHAAAWGSARSKAIGALGRHHWKGRDLAVVVEDGAALVGGDLGDRDGIWAATQSPGPCRGRGMTVPVLGDAREEFLPCDSK